MQLARLGPPEGYRNDTSGSKTKVCPWLAERLSLIQERSSVEVSPTRLEGMSKTSQTVWLI